MSDQDYTSFLERASADAQPAPTTTSTPKPQSTSTKTVTTQTVHPALSSLPSSLVYTTDSDEPFRAVSLPFSSTSLSAATFASAVEQQTGHAPRGPTELKTKEFDPRGEYAQVVARAAEAAGVDERDVRVFRSEGGGARCEYWVLAVGKDKGEEGVLVGFVVLGVES